MNRTAFALMAALISSLPALAQPPGGPGGAGASGDGIWRRNAYYGEFLTFDSCLGHQPQRPVSLSRHPVCLRAELNDNLVTLRTGRTGHHLRRANFRLAPFAILGWALDGYPVYGPYGYSKATDATSAVKRIQSSYQLRSITTRTTLPTWSLPNHSGVSQNLTTSQYGPAVSTQFPLGRYLEDYDYIAGPRRSRSVQRALRRHAGVSPGHLCLLHDARQQRRARVPLYPRRPVLRDGQRKLSHERDCHHNRLLRQRRVHQCAHHSRADLMVNEIFHKERGYRLGLRSLCRTGHHMARNQHARRQHLGLRDDPDACRDPANTLFLFIRLRHGQRPGWIPDGAMVLKRHDGGDLFQLPERVQFDLSDSQ
jgi:hypothetical protein